VEDGRQVHMSNAKIPSLSAVLEALADAVEGWADELGIELTYTDPAIEETGRNNWAYHLRGDSGRPLVST